MVVLKGASPLLSSPEVFSSASDKANLFAEKSFLKNSILMTLVSIYLFFLSGTNLKPSDA